MLCEFCAEQINKCHNYDCNSSAAQIEKNSFERFSHTFSQLSLTERTHNEQTKSKKGKQQGCSPCSIFFLVQKKIVSKICIQVQGTTIGTLHYTTHIQ